MKKVILFFFSLLVCTQLAKAQYVTIPDANFRSLLQSFYPSCFNGSGQMDTTCSASIPITTLNCFSQSISDLSGIQYFTHLTALDCSNNHLTSLPALLPNLSSLHCGRNQLTGLPTLPVTLTTLSCESNQITSLPALPTNLSSLTCSHNQIASMPALPANMSTLDCSYNHLMSLPASLPANMSTMNCAYNQLTSLPALPSSITNLICASNQLTSLPILPTNTALLSCGHNQLTSLPSLPASMTQLDCSFNQLTSLPVFPAVVQDLRCDNNQITVLPAVPNSVQRLVCSNNQLTNLPVLPTSLFQLYCDYNQLASLPTLPASLTTLSCSNNNMEGLPALPAGLTRLYCNKNNLVSLPALPATLSSFMCKSNNLVSLPPLPASLVGLDCSYNQLASIPTLPAGLPVLVCDHNQLTYLPAPLPSGLLWLFCNNNTNLSCLPYLPPNLDSCLLMNTNIQCLPNAAPNLQSVSLPICTSNHTCSGSTFAIGNVYYDANNNGQRDSAEVLLPNYFLTESHSGYFSVSQGYGYSIQIDSMINDTIRVVNTLPLVQTIHPVSQVVSMPNSGQAPGSYDFGVQLTSGVNDLKVSLAHYRARPGFSGNIILSVSNDGSTTPSDTLLLTMPPSWVINSTTPTASSITGNVVSWNISQMPLFSKQTFTVNITVSASLSIGTPYTITASMPLTGDITPHNNIAIDNGRVVGSFDPNEKSVTPDRLDPGYSADQLLNYTINFQNTGTDTAFSVMVVDTLPLNVDPASVRVVNTSHQPYYVYMEGQRVMKVVFPVIHLLDSTHNEPLSHGFVQFAVKPIAGLPEHTAINNKAYIYFDYNTPVVTNTAAMHVDYPLSVTELTWLNNLSVAPNPTRDQLFISLSIKEAASVQVELLNTLGQVVSRQDKQTAQTEQFSFDVHDLAAGMYFVRIAIGDKQVVRKVVVQR